MEEKIKLTLPKQTAELLRRDAEDFKICKPSGEPNMNAFLNRLVLHDYERFSASEEDLSRELSQALSGLSPREREPILARLRAVYARRAAPMSAAGESTSLSFRPTRASEAAVLHIERVLLGGESLSSFYRRLFTSYAALPKNERERIIHRECEALLCRAAAEGRLACIGLESGAVIERASVFAVAPAREELFNYVLLCDGKKNITCRLASVRSVTLRSEQGEIPEENRALFRRQLEIAPQYPFYSTDREPIRVRLTEKGKELFRKIYLYRPTPSAVEGDIYTFECSANQLLYYFERFGENALILSPRRLGIFMRNYHYYALKKYRTEYE